ncbi:hypothetical protein [uncultured Adlercreutzia sp.]|uniref:hypothetical protein n=1 Tax=uncultured Adlercreutzia sp. TaxID=875803 RepID=UPI0026F3D942|nr:hypothetical protein [uncultured Adlercreutzia sp.]
MEAADTISTIDASKKCFSALRDVGIVDSQTGSLTALGEKWASSEEYQSACTDILARFFPSELNSAYSDGSMTRKQVARWLADRACIGKAGAEKNATFFLYLQDGARLGHPILMATHDNAVEHTALLDEPMGGGTPETISISIDPSLSADKISNILTAVSTSLSDNALNIVFK